MVSQFEELKVKFKEEINANYGQVESVIESNINVLAEKTTNLDSRIALLEKQNEILTERLKWMEKLFYQRNRDINYCMERIGSNDNLLSSSS